MVAAVAFAILISVCLLAASGVHLRLPVYDLTPF